MRTTISIANGTTSRVTGWRRLAKLFVGVTIAGGALVGPVTPAGAASPYLHTAGSTRDCTNTALPGCAPWSTLAAGTQLSMVCWIDDSWAVGEHNSNRWFYVVTTSGVKAFVHSSRVWDQTSVPHCSTHRGVMVTRWAAQHVDVRETTATERSAAGISSNYWAGYCAGFASAAYKLGAGATPRYAGDARPRYYNYKRDLLTRTGTPTNVGSLVFWPNLTEWGHVAVYVGNGMVVSTRGIPGETKVVERVPLSTFGTAAGWVEYWNV